MNFQNLSAAQLRKAASLAEKIEKLNARLDQIIGGGSTPAEAPRKRGPKKGGMSAEGRARIAAAQKARWARVKAGKTA